MSVLDYIGTCPECSALVFWCAGERSRECSKDIARVIREGYGIERVTLTEAKARRFGHTDECSRNKRKKKARQQPSLFVNP